MTTLETERPIDLGVTIPSQDETIEGDWSVPLHPKGAIVIANGTGNGRWNRRNRAVARAMYDAGYATLLVDLLTANEEREDALTGAFRLDIELLSSRLTAACRWVAQAETPPLPIGLLTSGVASAAAVVVCVEEPELVDVLVSRGGRPDLAGLALYRMTKPTLLIAGSADRQVVELNRWALRRVRGAARIEIVAGASHLFEERGAMDQVTQLAIRWFEARMQGFAISATLHLEESWTSR